jgi:tetratricopeptide (TPR) repeat protein
MIKVRERWLVAGALCLILWPAVSCTQDVRWEKMMSLGEKALQEGRLARAEKYFLEALSEAENSGASEELLAASLNNLAAVYRAQGKYAQAEPLYQRALGIYETALGPEHPHVADTLENYADLLRKMERDAEAEEMEKRAKAIRAKHAQEPR